MKTKVLFIAAVLLLVGASLLVLPASATTAQHIKVTPNTGLVLGSKVTVTGSGFKHHEALYIVECAIGATGAAKCDITGTEPVTTTATGALPPTMFRVVTGKIGSARCGTTKANANRCDISVGTATGTDTATFRIGFKIKK